MITLYLKNPGRVRSIDCNNIDKDNSPHINSVNNLHNNIANKTSRYFKNPNLSFLRRRSMTTRNIFSLTIACVISHIPTYYFNNFALCPTVQSSILILTHFFEEVFQHDFSHQFPITIVSTKNYFLFLFFYILKIN